MAGVIVAAILTAALVFIYFRTRTPAVRTSGEALTLDPLKSCHVTRLYSPTGIKANQFPPPISEVRVMENPLYLASEVVVGQWPGKATFTRHFRNPLYDDTECEAYDEGEYSGRK